MDDELGRERQDEDAEGDGNAAVPRIQQRRCFWRRMWNRIKLVCGLVKPGPRAWQGAAVGLLATGGLVYLVVALWILLLARENLATYIIALVLPLLALLAGGLGLLVVRLLNFLPSFYLWTLATVISIVAFIYAGLGPLGILLGILVCILVGSLIGASLRILASGKGHDLTKVQRWITVCGFAAGIALAGATTWWLAWDGRQAKDVANAALETTGVVWSAESRPADPSQSGPCRVLQLTYGSGTDRHRPEYGGGVTIRTRTVDGSRLIERWSGRHGWARTGYWGFDAKKLPLQARVWYPEGNGPFGGFSCLFPSQASDPGADAPPCVPSVSC